MPQPPTAEAPSRRGAIESVDDRGGAALGLAVSWRAIVTPLICVLGLGAATYLTVVHFTGAKIAVCQGTGAIDCMKVTTSPESYVFGIPVAVLGLAFFVPMLVLCSPWAWRSAHPLVAPVRVAAAVAGIGFVFYLVYAELFEIKAICLWCTSVHILTFLLFVCVITGWDDARSGYWEREQP